MPSWGHSVMLRTGEAVGQKKGFWQGRRREGSPRGSVINHLSVLQGLPPSSCKADRDKENSKAETGS